MKISKIASYPQVESVVTAIVDLFPDYLRVGRRREALVFGVCSFDFLLGCTMVMQVRILFIISSVGSMMTC